MTTANAIIKVLSLFSSLKLASTSRSLVASGSRCLSLQMQTLTPIAASDPDKPVAVKKRKKAATNSEIKQTKQPNIMKIILQDVIKKPPPTKKVATENSEAKQTKLVKTNSRLMLAAKALEKKAPKIVVKKPLVKNIESPTQQTTSSAESSPKKKKSESPKKKEVGVIKLTAKLDVASGNEAVLYPILTEYEDKKLDFKFGEFLFFNNHS
jgi:hypothetical protein